jgi:hypothetical protein
MLVHRTSGHGKVACRGLAMPYEGVSMRTSGRGITRRYLGAAALSSRHAACQAGGRSFEHTDLQDECKQDAAR